LPKIPAAFLIILVDRRERLPGAIELAGGAPAGPSVVDLFERVCDGEIIVSVVIVVVAVELRFGLR
jgi:hypothetical protein